MLLLAFLVFSVGYMQDTHYITPFSRSTTLLTSSITVKTTTSIATTTSTETTTLASTTSTSKSTTSTIAGTTSTVTGTSVTSTVTGTTTVATTTIPLYPITISESPSAAANYWGACFIVTSNTGNYPQTCAGDGVSSNSVSYPQGSHISYICTADWNGGSYSFSSWSGAYNGVECTSGLDIPINAGLSINANYALNSTTVSSTSTTTKTTTSTTTKTTSSTTTIAQLKYNTFQEYGLPAGTEWSVEINGQTYSSTANTIPLSSGIPTYTPPPSTTTIHITTTVHSSTTATTTAPTTTAPTTTIPTSVLYEYDVGYIPGYSTVYTSVVRLSSKYVTLPIYFFPCGSGAPSNDFNYTACDLNQMPVIFDYYTLPAGAEWSLYINSKKYTASTKDIIVSLPAGTYTAYAENSSGATTQSTKISVFYQTAGINGGFGGDYYVNFK